MDNHELAELLRTAARALDIGLEWEMPYDVQIDPLPKWGLSAYYEDKGDGWVSVVELVRFLRSTANEVENE